MLEWLYVWGSLCLSFAQLVGFVGAVEVAFYLGAGWLGVFACTCVFGWAVIVSVHENKEDQVFAKELQQIREEFHGKR